jgi:hypothetical protein
VAQRKAGRTYRAPEALRGRRMALVDGRRLDIAKNGSCALAAAGARPGRGASVESLAAHRQLVDAGFVMTETMDEFDGR